MKRHFETNDPNCIKIVEFFEQKLKYTTKFATENKLAVYSSYIASYQIAEKSHIAGEDLLTPVMKEEAMFGEKEVRN